MSTRIPFYAHIADPEHSIQMTTDRYVQEQYGHGIISTAIRDVNAPWLHAEHHADRDSAVAESKQWLRDWLSQRTDPSDSVAFEIHFHQKIRGSDIVLDAIEQLRGEEGIPAIGPIVRFHEVERIENSRSKDAAQEQAYLREVLQRAGHAIFSCAEDADIARRIRREEQGLGEMVREIMPRYYPYGREDIEQAGLGKAKQPRTLLFHGCFEPEKGLDQFYRLLPLVRDYNTAHPEQPIHLRVTGRVAARNAKDFDAFLKLSGQEEYRGMLSFKLGGPGVRQVMGAQGGVTIPAGSETTEDGLENHEVIQEVRAAGAFLILDNEVLSPRSSTVPLAAAHQTALLVLGEGTKFEEIASRDMVWFAPDLTSIPDILRRIGQGGVEVQTRLARAHAYQRAVEPDSHFDAEHRLAHQAIGERALPFDKRHQWQPEERRVDAAAATTETQR